MTETARGGPWPYSETGDDAEDAATRRVARHTKFVHYGPPHDCGPVHEPATDSIRTPAESLMHHDEEDD